MHCEEGEEGVWCHVEELAEGYELPGVVAGEVVALSLDYIVGGSNQHLPYLDDWNEEAKQEQLQLRLRGFHYHIFDSFLFQQLLQD